MKYQQGKNKGKKKRFANYFLISAEHITLYSKHRRDSSSGKKRVQFHLPVQCHMEIYCQLQTPNINNKNKRVSINFVVIQDCYRKSFIFSVVQEVIFKQRVKINAL